jgi:hypothetical protein
MNVKKNSMKPNNTISKTTSHITFFSVQYCVYDMEKSSPVLVDYESISTSLEGWPDEIFFKFLTDHNNLDTT